MSTSPKGGYPRKGECRLLGYCNGNGPPPAGEGGPAVYAGWVNASSP